ncbi:MAG: PKD domain-containing protein [Gammaproteobacteria bacterium]|nr:PKD domain-containing protein [Gammaproteobacteria bacterium]
MSHLIISGAETVTDTSDGLVWQREDDGTTYTWEGASAHCESLVLNEKSDWRLPLVDELKRLIEYGQYNPSSDASIFPGIRSSYYWSDSTVNPPSNAWDVNFNNGSVYWGNKDSTRYVRCVRGGSGAFDPLNNLIISAAPTGGPAPLEVSFSAGFADGLDPYTYAWNFGDGATAAEESPVHSYDVGTHTATLTLTDIMGDSLTDSVTITVTPADPIPVFTFSPDNQILPIMYVTFDASGSSDPDGGSITDYAWLIEGQTYSGMTVGHSFSSAGSYQATLTVTDDEGATDSIQKTITVLDAGPTAILSLTPSSGKLPLTVTLDGSASSDPDGPIAAYEYLVNGQTKNGATASYTFSALGTYPVILTVTDSADQTDSQEKTVVVSLNQQPQAVFSDPADGFAPLTVNLDGSASTDPDGSIVAYAWMTSDGQSATGSTTSFIFSTPGTYSITLEVTDDSGDTHSLTHEAIVDIKPVYALNLSAGTGGNVSRSPDQTDYDAGDSVTLTATPGECYEFDHWAGNCTGDVPVCALFMDQGKSVTAHFRKKAFPLHINAAHGTVSQSPLSMSYECGSSVELNAQPETGYRFTVWEGLDRPQDTHLDNEATVFMDAERTLNAAFDLATYSVTLSASPDVPGVEAAVSPVKAAYTGNETLTFTAAAGGGYRFDHWQGDLSGAQAGMTVKIAQDMTVTAVFALTDALAITPALSETVTGNTVPLSAVGGVPEYIWQAPQGGTITPNQGEHVNYTPPAGSGSYSIAVTDAQGASANAEIIVYDALAVLPASAEVEVSGQHAFAISGGKPPYKADNVTQGQASIAQNTLTYAADAVAGTVSVTIKDSLEQARSVQIQVIAISLPVITPAELTLEQQGTAALSVTGGKAPYKWTAQAGNLSANTGDRAAYTAPETAGEYWVRVTDARNQAVEAAVSVIPPGSPPVITPASAVLSSGESKTFQIAGGKKPYVSVSALHGQISEQGGDSFFVYTAPELVTSDTVTVADSLGQNGAAQIIVTEPVLCPNPKEVTAAQGEAVSLSVGCGVAPYAWQASQGDFSATQGDRVTYFAPDMRADVTVTVTDKTGKSADVIVHVIGDLLISPASAHLVLDTNQSVLFKAINGVESFIWTAPQGGQLQEDGGQAIYTPPAQIGKYTVRVTDGQNSVAQAFVSVVNLPKVSPARVILQVEELHGFQVIGGEPPYVWTAEQGGFSRHEGVSTKHIASADSGVYLLTATDSFGHRSTAQAVVNDGLEIRPAQALADVNETRYFAVSGGVPPYIWSDGSEGANLETARSATGRHEIFVSDSAGHSAAALLEVKAESTEELLPQVTHARPGETVVFKIESPGLYVWKAGAGSLAGHEGQQVSYTVPEEPGKYYVQVSDGSREDYTKVLVGLDLIGFDGNAPENAKPVLSQMAVDGVPRHERVLEGDQETLWDIGFFMFLPDDGQYNTHLAIFWTDVTGEIPPRVFLQTNNPDEPYVDFHALPPGALLPANREGVSGEQRIDVYRGSLAGVVGTLDFFLGYAPADKPGALVYTPVPYRLDVK